MENENLSQETILLKTLVFQMYEAGMTQEAISKYVGKGKKTVNEWLQPLPKKEKKNG